VDTIAVPRRVTITSSRPSNCMRSRSRLPDGARPLAQDAAGSQTSFGTQSAPSPSSTTSAKSRNFLAVPLPSAASSTVLGTFSGTTFGWGWISESIVAAVAMLLAVALVLAVAATIVAMIVAATVIAAIFVAVVADIGTDTGTDRTTDGTAQDRAVAATHRVADSGTGTTTQRTADHGTGGITGKGRDRHRGGEQQSGGNILQVHRFILALQ